MRCNELNKNNEQNEFLLGMLSTGSLSEWGGGGLIR